eukprot:scaffold684_cov345-Pavlova_lutheri.AAC.82
MSSSSSSSPEVMRRCSPLFSFGSIQRSLPSVPIETRQDVRTRVCDASCAVPPTAPPREFLLYGPSNLGVGGRIEGERTRQGEGPSHREGEGERS